MGQILRPAVFLDRDGTLNVEKGYLFRREDFCYLPGVVDGLKCLISMGFILVIITNQSGIARGFYTEEDYRRLNEWMLADFEQKGIEISGSYYCPHHPDGVVLDYVIKCNCRKPATGLFWQAQKELGIDMDKSYAIGDKLRDLAICEESGVQGLLIGKGGLIKSEIRDCISFREAVKKIEREVVDEL